MASFDHLERPYWMPLDADPSVEVAAAQDHDYLAMLGIYDEFVSGVDRFLERDCACDHEAYVEYHGLLALGFALLNMVRLGENGIVISAGIASTYEAYRQMATIKDAARSLADGTEGSRVEVLKNLKQKLCDCLCSYKSLCAKCNKWKVGDKSEYPKSLIKRYMRLSAVRHIAYLVDNGTGIAEQTRSELYSLAHYLYIANAYLGGSLLAAAKREKRIHGEYYTEFANAPFLEHMGYDGPYANSADMFGGVKCAEDSIVGDIIILAKDFRTMCSSPLQHEFLDEKINARFDQLHGIK